jgi:predicted membrane-bound mannosyltransferase
MFSLTGLVSSLWRRRDNKYILIFVVLTALFFVTRLYHLLALPIFSDEGIYIQWAKMAAQDGGMRFMPRSWPPAP